MKASAIFFTACLIVLSISCSKHNYQSGNRSFSDVSLTRTSDEYTIKRLPEVVVEGTSFWGIPTGIKNEAKKSSGMVVRINGMEIGHSIGILPVLSLIGYTVGIGTMVNTIGKDKNNGDRPLGLPLSAAVALPIAGIFNNYTWKELEIKRLARIADFHLINDNPKVDVFLNPKYRVENTSSIWGQRTKVNAKVMGATIK